MIEELVEAAVAEVVTLVRDAINGGVSKETLVDAIKATMTEASDAEMAREFPNG